MIGPLMWGMLSVANGFLALGLAANEEADDNDKVWAVFLVAAGVCLVMGVRSA